MPIHTPGARPSTRALRLALVALVAIFAALPATALGAAWSPQTSGTTAHLYDVSCPTTTSCVAVGDSGVVRKTTDGGATWTAGSSGSTATLSGVACPSTTTCYAVGWSGALLKSTDFGSTWSSQTFNTSDAYYEISCTSTTSCVIAGSPDRIYTTTNGGSSWTQRVSGTTSNDLTGVSCPTSSTCYVVTNPSGKVLKSTDGGATWTGQTISTAALSGVSCSDASTCTATGASGTIRRTTNGSTWTTQSAGTSSWVFDVVCPSSSICFAGDGLVAPAQSKIYSTSNGGSTWSATSTGTSNDVEGFSCPTTTTCFMVGGGGMIQAYDAVPPAPPTITSKPSDPSSSSNASFSFTGEPGGSYECQLDGGAWTTCSSPKSYSGLSDGSHTFCVRQTDAANNVGSPQCYTWTVDLPASDECQSASSTVVDGYSGGTYLRLRVERRSDRTVVCFRGQDGALPYLGGKIVVTDPSAGIGVPTVDDRADDCSTTGGNQVPGPHPLLDGQVGPNNTPVKVDTYAAGGVAWVCLQVGSDRARVIVPTSAVTAPTVTPDLDAPQPAPAPSTGPSSYPSSTCQTSGGESGRVTNIDVPGGHLSVYTAHPAASQAQVCVRVDGPVGLGGMLDIGGVGGVGPVPVPQVADGSCPAGGTNVVGLESPTHIKIRAYSGGSSVAVCVEALGDSDPNRVRKVITVDTTLSPTLPTVHFVPDPGTPVPGI